MSRWTLDDIPWNRFDRGKLDPEIARIVKAASLVEYNGGAYAHHLCRIFDDDPDFQQALLEMNSEAERMEAIISFFERILPVLQRSARAKRKAGGNGHVS